MPAAGLQMRVKQRQKALKLFCSVKNFACLQLFFSKNKKYKGVLIEEICQQHLIWSNFLAQPGYIDRTSFVFPVLRGITACCCLLNIEPLKQFAQLCLAALEFGLDNASFNIRGNRAIHL